MVNSMVEADALTQEDIDEMRSILDQARKEARET
jgi:hypothetical protein